MRKLLLGESNHFVAAEAGHHGVRFGLGDEAGQTLEGVVQRASYGLIAAP